LDDLDENPKSTAEDEEFTRIKTAIDVQSQQLIGIYVEKKTMIGFCWKDRHILGHVFAASGYKESFY
jgi:hypothetical protein